VSQAVALVKDFCCSSLFTGQMSCQISQYAPPFLQAKFESGKEDGWTTVWFLSYSIPILAADASFVWGLASMDAMTCPMCVYLCVCLASVQSQI
jgi:hypothetical protein